MATTLEKLQGDEQTERVGTSLTVAPSVRVLDQGGQPLPGETVTFTVIVGGGSVVTPSAVTNSQGVASAASWTLGTIAGSQTLSASIGSLPAATFRATALPGAPSNVTLRAGSGQQARVSEPVPTPPSVRVTDAFENPTPGVQVTFQVALGAGQIDGGTQLTDAEGVATLALWTLGQQAGENRLAIAVAGGPTTFVSAEAQAGLPAAMFRQQGDGRTAEVLTDVSPAPSARVVDAYGNAVSGVTVTFAVTQGGGAVEPAAVTTGADGVATVTRWKVGRLAGANALTASAPGLPTVTFVATATAAAPADISVWAGQNQTAATSSQVGVRPAVRVIDAHGNPVEGATVTFVVVAGGGLVQGATQLTNRLGIATVGAWVLGAQPGANTLEARVSGAQPFRFEATASTGSGGGTDNASYDIDLRIISGLTPSQQQIFMRAAERWETVITGDLPGGPLPLEANSCGTHPALNERLDDILIFASAVTIDGPGSILGRAGPCLLRSEGGLPGVGFMEFDVADMAMLEANGNLEAVILHEIGHVLGIGTIWEMKGLLSGKGGPDPVFTGAGAVAAFNDIGGTAYAGAKVPVENSGGGGTRDAHWRESVLRTEVMTGFINVGVANPMSILTIASLADLGYTVDVSRADPFTLNAALRAPGAGGERMEYIELPVPPPLTIDRNGVIRRPQPR